METMETQVEEYVVGREDLRSLHMVRACCPPTSLRQMLSTVEILREMSEDKLKELVIEGKVFVNNLKVRNYFPKNSVGVLDVNLHEGDLIKIDTIEFVFSSILFNY